MAETRIPHSLRFTIFLLRLALGLNFFYLGWTALFDRSLGAELGGRSLGDLYAWIGASFGIGAPLRTLLAWAFLAIGACLIAGLATRLAAILGIALTLLSYAPSVTIAPLNLAQFANDAVLATAALLVSSSRTQARTWAWTSSFTSTWPGNTDEPFRRAVQQASPASCTPKKFEMTKGNPLARRATTTAITT